MTTKINLTIVLTICTASLVFAFSGGSGTPESPFLISQAAHLELINNDLSAHYELAADLFLGDTYTQSPIAPHSYQPFTGSFDGSGFEIHNLKIDAPSKDGVGLFGYLGSAAVIKNVGLIGADITGRYYVGALAGTNGVGVGLGGDIINCYSATAVVTAKQPYSGGLVGFNNGSITNCHTSGIVDGSGLTGGLVGESYNNGVIIRCYSSVSLQHTFGSSLGGLVGRNLGSVEFSSATGEVGSQFGSYIGGLVGDNRGTITSSYTVGSNIISANSYIGGLVGQNREGEIIDCYTNRSAQASSNNVGGLVGYNNNGDIIRCHATGSASGSTYIGGLVGETYQGSITLSVANGSADGYSNIGGLVGRSYDATISFCYATGDARGTTIVGGLIGTNDTGSLVSRCYAVGKVSASVGNPAGGLAAAGMGNVLSSFWDIQTSQIDITHGSGQGLLTPEMMNINTYLDAGWDFVNESENGNMEIWYMPVDDYPKLYWYAHTGDVNYDGEVDLDDLIIIAQQWLSAAGYLQRLTADINGDGFVDIIDFAMFADSYMLLQQAIE